jgi:hypothetical protein
MLKRGIVIVNNVLVCALNLVLTIFLKPLSIQILQNRGQQWCIVNFPSRVVVEHVVDEICIPILLGVRPQQMRYCEFIPHGM